MKNKLLIVFVLLVIMLGTSIGLSWANNRINMSFAKVAEVRFIFGEKNISCPLSSQELELVKSMFSGKRFYKDNPSCGFSEEISIIFNETQTFCIARDTCPIIYWMEKDCYIQLKKSEMIQLHDLLEQYGFFFPCI